VVRTEEDETEKSSLDPENFLNDTSQINLVEEDTNLNRSPRT